MVNKQQEQFYRYGVEALFSLASSPAVFENALKSVPQLFNVVMPLYYIADAAVYTYSKQDITGHKRVNYGTTFLNRLERNAYEYMTNYASALLSPLFFTLGGTPLSVCMYAVVALIKVAIERDYESKEHKEELLSNNMPDNITVPVSLNYNSLF